MASRITAKAVAHYVDEFDFSGVRQIPIVTTITGFQSFSL